MELLCAGTVDTFNFALDTLKYCDSDKGFTRPRATLLGRALLEESLSYVEEYLATAPPDAQSFLEMCDWKMAIMIALHGHELSEDMSEFQVSVPRSMTRVTQTTHVCVLSLWPSTSRSWRGKQRIQNL